MLITSYILKKVRIHKNCPQINLKYQRTDAFFSIFHIWVCNKETCYFLEQNDFEGFFEFKTLKRIEHFKISHYSLPLLWSPVVVIHKALRYKLTCSVDHIISQPILICCRMGVREGKDTKRSLKDKNIELILQNVWNTQTLTDDWLMRSPV